ncbi:hypothetical protein [Kitasatospora cheerisanensis]|uniref:Uncharacterized protein n=1 Tax=Kitasatospora cheerisanensis KCTC 2395 TaxID=1348663 RepID=A0A066ZAR7_9ACTN|nr:hypothetical protein [Kitasatospora cheerisanensis]KDN87210.1 hypothetical protein KCH_10310 [Kitasatospora cheerisanensis KCTC 2395]
MAGAALLAYLPGLWASRSGGLVEVERRLDHPVLLVGSAVLLVVVSVVIEFEFRTMWSQVGCAAALVILGFVGLPIGYVSIMFGDNARELSRTVNPEHPEHALAVTDTSASIDPFYEVQVLTGSGWSTRHWDLGGWGEGDGRGYFNSAEWTGPNEITVTSDRETTVFTVDPETGRPSEPRITRK